MIDHELHACAEAGMADDAQVLELPHPAAPGLVLELVYDRGVILVASWRLGAS